MGRAASILALLALVACGSAPAPRRAPQRTRDVLPAAGATFSGRHRVIAMLDGVELAALRARVQVWVIERREAEADLWARVQLLAPEGGVPALDDVRLTIDATGRVHRLRSLCTDAAFDELASTRLVAAMLGVGPTWSGGAPTERGVIGSELEERTSEGAFRSRAEHGDEDDDLTVLGRGELSLLGVTLGDVHLRGAVTVRMRQRFEHASLLRRRSESRLEGTVEARSGSATRRAALRVESDSILETAEASAPPEAACSLGTPAPNDESVDQGTLFAMQSVVRMIDLHRAQITQCYEAGLRTNPALRGRVRVSMTVEESGEVTNVRVVEDTLLDADVTACVVAVVDGFYFRPGPVGEPVTYAFPFVFSPAD